MPSGENQKPGSRPLLRDWLSMSRAELATYVLPHRLAVMVSIDGTQRHYLLKHPETNGQIVDYVAYADHNANAYVQLFGLLFELGVHTILTTSMSPPNFQRGERGMSQLLAMSEAFLTKAPFTGFYRRWQVQARLFGDYDLAPAATPIREALQALDQQMSALSPGRERLLLFGYCASTFADEQIARTQQLYAALNRFPTADELRRACFPHGPDRVHLYLLAGRLRVGQILPPLLDMGTADVYALSHLMLDLSEKEARRILYDHLFMRSGFKGDNVGYTPADLAALSAFYDDHRDYVTGIGQIVGPVFYLTDPSALEQA